MIKMAEIKLMKNNFDDAVLKSDKPVLVDFWASWCGPCMMLAPVIEEIAEDYEDEVAVGKVNVDEEPELSAKYGIESIPTLLLFKNGAVVKKSVGYLPKNSIEEMLD